MDAGFKEYDLVRFRPNADYVVARICRERTITPFVCGFTNGCVVLTIPGLPYRVYAKPDDIEFVADASAFPVDPGDE